MRMILANELEGLAACWRARKRHSKLRAGVPSETFISFSISDIKLVEDICNVDEITQDVNSNFNINNAICRRPQNRSFSHCEKQN